MADTQVREDSPKRPDAPQPSALHAPYDQRQQKTEWRLHRAARGPVYLQEATEKAEKIARNGKISTFGTFSASSSITDALYKDYQNKVKQTFKDVENILVKMPSTTSKKDMLARLNKSDFERKIKEAQEAFLKELALQKAAIMEALHEETTFEALQEKVKAQFAAENVGLSQTFDTFTQQMGQAWDNSFTPEFFQFLEDRGFNTVDEIRAEGTALTSGETAGKEATFGKALPQEYIRDSHDGTATLVRKGNSIFVRNKPLHERLFARAKNAIMGEKRESPHEEALMELYKEGYTKFAVNCDHGVQEQASDMRRVAAMAAQASRRGAEGILDPHWLLFGLAKKRNNKICKKLWEFGQNLDRPITITRETKSDKERYGTGVDYTSTTHGKQTKAEFEAKFDPDQLVRVRAKAGFTGEEESLEKEKEEGFKVRGEKSEEKGLEITSTPHPGGHSG